MAGADPTLPRQIRLVDLVIRAEKAVIDGDIRAATIAVSNGVISAIDADCRGVEDIQLDGSMVHSIVRKPFDIDALGDLISAAAGPPVSAMAALLATRRRRA